MRFYIISGACYTIFMRNATDYLKIKQWNIWTHCAFFVAVLLAGIAIGWTIEYGKVRIDRGRGEVIRETSHTYGFINPLLGCEIADKKEFKELKPVKDKIRTLIDKKISQRDATSIGTYVRKINTGQWAGVNEDEQFSPASLLKVPTLIAYLKLAETNPRILSQKLYYDGAIDRNMSEYFKSGQSIERGYYMISDLLERMIVHSGNNSHYLLKEYLDPAVLQEIYNDLRLPIPQSRDDVDFMSAKEYALVLRTLYSATYLSREMSEKALELLSKTTFKDGLVMGVPATTIVSHKFGERTVFFSNGEVKEKELHDCGIIYHPEQPYLLCIMTKGDDFKNLQTTIADISRLVYTEIDNFTKT